MATEMKRDGRITNAMTPDVQRVHFALVDWSKLALGPDGRAWPAATMLARVIEQGINGAGQVGPEKIEWPQAVKNTERAVNSLGQIDQRVIKTFYGSNNPKEVMARDAGHMRVKEFDNVLKRARWRILGFLDGSRNNV